jgi:hypothetical protein
MPFGVSDSGSSGLGVGDNSNLAPSLHSDGDSLNSDDDLAEQLRDLHVPEYESCIDSDSNPDDTQLPIPSIDETEEQNLPDDPLFSTRDSLFDSAADNDDVEGDGPNNDDLPAAFRDDPAIRNAYVRSFVAAAFHRSTREAVGIILNGARISLRSVQRKAPGIDNRGLDKFALTLPTVEKRLGVSTDALITYYFLCPRCWEVYKPSHLYKLPSPSCVIPSCDGILYTSQRPPKRSPTLIVPFVPLKKVIQRLLLR